MVVNGRDRKHQQDAHNKNWVHILCRPLHPVTHIRFVGPPCEGPAAPLSCLLFLQAPSFLLLWYISI